MSNSSIVRVVVHVLFDMDGFYYNKNVLVPAGGCVSVPLLLNEVTHNSKSKKVIFHSRLIVYFNGIVRLQQTAETQFLSEPERNFTSRGLYCISELECN